MGQQYIICTVRVNIYRTYYWTHARMQIREHRTQRYIMGTVYVVFNAASKNRQQKFSQKNG